MTGGRLVIEQVSKTYYTAEGESLLAVDQVSLTVEPGEFVSVIGPSGCGKSTLLGIVGGLIADYQGRVSIDGHPIDGSHSDIGMVFQEESTFPWRTALHNVAFPLEAAGMERAQREDQAMQFIKLVGLDGFENRYPSELSGGMRQRIAIARTLAFEPRIMLMDEPFGSLDEQTRLLLGDKVLQIWEQLGQTILLITHNITEAVQLSTRIIVMSYRPGRIKQIIDIDLPRPRTSKSMSTEQFGNYVGRIWEDLREEAGKGMAEEEAHVL